MLKRVKRASTFGQAVLNRSACVEQRRDLRGKIVRS